MYWRRRWLKQSEVDLSLSLRVLYVTVLLRVKALAALETGMSHRQVALGIDDKWCRLEWTVISEDN